MVPVIVNGMLRRGVNPTSQSVGQNMLPGMVARCG